MGTSYNQETLLITDAIVPIQLSHAIWWYLGCEGEGLYAEITVQSGDLLFRVDGGDPYSAHCQYGLQYCEQATEQDVIKLETLAEIMGFRAVKKTDNCLISIIYYKGV